MAEKRDKVEMSLEEDNNKTEERFRCRGLGVESRYFRLITTAVWAIAGAFNFGIVGDFSMFFVYLEKDFQSSILALNWLGNLPWMLFCVVSPLSNLLAQKFGYRWVIIGSNLACAVGLFASSFPNQIWPMYLTYGTIFGGCSVMYYTIGCVYITQYFDEKSCKGPVSSMGCTFELAVLMFSPLIQITSDSWGWRWAVRLLSAGTLVMTGLLVLGIREPPQTQPKRNHTTSTTTTTTTLVTTKVSSNGYEACPSRDGDHHSTSDRPTEDGDQETETVTSTSDTTATAVKNYRYERIQSSDNDHGFPSVEKAIEAGDRPAEKETMVSMTMTTSMTSSQRYLFILSTPTFWVVQLALLISFTALAFNHINLGSYLTSLGVPTHRTAALHSCLAGGAVCGRLLVTLLSHKLPVPIASLYPVIALLNCFLISLLLSLTSTWYLYIYSSLVGLLRALYFSLITGLAVELFGKDNAAEAYTGVFFSYGVGSVLSALIPGIIHKMTGSYLISILTCAVMWAVSAILFAAAFALHRRRLRLRSKRSDEKHDLDDIHESKNAMSQNL